MCHSLALSRSISGCPRLGPPNHDPSPPAFRCLMATIPHLLPYHCSRSSGPCLSRSSKWLLWNRSLINNSKLLTRPHRNTWILHTGSGKPGAYSQPLHTTAALSFLSCQTCQLQGSSQSPGSQNWLIIGIIQAIRNTNPDPTVQDWFNQILYHQKN